ncbi:MAG: glycerol-3-phosphate dehydrogenase [Flavobacteriales bacterium]|nr:MAG: glycerol-3-phosphate dehydrogenase [Flavobacteriales bacterium]
MGNTKKSIGIIGSGSWATALVKMISDAQEPVNWWIRKPEKAAYIASHHHNPDYLSGVEIHPEKVDILTDLQDILDRSDILILAIPSAFLHQSLSGVTLPKDRIYVSAIKGIEPFSNKVIARYLESHHGISPEQIAIISGPCHAEEVAEEKLSYLTIASSPLSLAESLKKFLEGPFIKVSCSEDPIGVEYAAVMKNIYAIGAGIAHGLAYGDNFLALYTSSAIREMNVFLHAVEPAERNINEAAYLGDLLVTCYSQFSRNRMFGNMLGKGYSVNAAQLEMNMIAEGYYAANLVNKKFTALNVTLPIANAVYKIIYEKASAKKTFQELSNNQLH